MTNEEFKKYVEEKREELFDTLIRTEFAFFKEKLARILEPFEKYECEAEEKIIPIVNKCCEDLNIELAGMFHKKVLEDLYNSLEKKNE